MIYVMSDLHGCYEKYLEIIKKIHLSADDTLYILGDVLDRGTGGISILLDMMSRPNVIMLRGNHDETALKILKCLFLPNIKYDEDKFVPVLEMWLSDGGKPTLDGFVKLAAPDKVAVLSYLNQSKLYDKVVVNGKVYMLSHTVPEFELMDEYENLTMESFLLGEPDYEEKYFDDRILVTGHTPTNLIGEEFAGRVYRANNHLAIDCGAVFPGGRLGCVCLDTMEEYYV